MIHNAVAEHNLIPHTADDRGVTPGYQRNWTRAHDLNTAALLSFSARERCRLEHANKKSAPATRFCCSYECRRFLLRTSIRPNKPVVSMMTLQGSGTGLPPALAVPTVTSSTISRPALPEYSREPAGWCSCQRSPRRTRVRVDSAY